MFITFESFYVCSFLKDIVQSIDSFSRDLRNEMLCKHSEEFTYTWKAFWYLLVFKTNTDCWDTMLLNKQFVILLVFLNRKLLISFYNDSRKVVFNACIGKHFKYLENCFLYNC